MTDMGGIVTERIPMSHLLPGDLYSHAEPEWVLREWGLGKYGDLRLRMRHPREYGPHQSRMPVTRVRYITATLREEVSW